MSPEEVEIVVSIVRAKLLGVELDYSQLAYVSSLTPMQREGLNRLMSGIDSFLFWRTLETLKNAVQEQGAVACPRRQDGEGHDL